MLCRRALCVPIRIYQYTLSPWICRSCRFSPSCSNYTMQAILTHGCVKGILLGAWRIARCNPLGRWGYDPVPPPGRWQSPARNLQPAKLFEKRHRGSAFYENSLSHGLRRASSLGEGALGIAIEFSAKAQSLQLRQEPHLRGGCRAQRDWGSSPGI